MDDQLSQDLKKQYEALPVEIQEAISDVNLSVKLQEIVRSNKLMVDQAGKLETETVLVLFGLEPLENYVKNLIKNVGLSSVQASIVAHNVNEAIFKNIRESLKKINDNVQNAETHFAQTDADLTQNNADEIQTQTQIQIQKQQNKDILPSLSSLIPKSIEPFHQNISPVQNIVETKLNNTIIVPKETIVIEEKDKLPEKSEMIDLYREQVN